MLYGRALSCVAAAIALCFWSVTASAQPKVSAAWSQILGQTELGEAGKLAPLNVHMRFVLDGESDLDCDDFTINLRGKTVLITRWTRREAFNVLGTAVCDAPMSEDWPEAKLLLNDGTPVVVDVLSPEGTTMQREVTFPGPSAIGRRQLVQSRGDTVEVAVVGNTGCLGDNNPIGKQDCTSTQSWPFAKVVSHIARSSMLPDLVLHLGNARYNRSIDSGWANWQREFFAPAQGLLLDVPWVFTRGDQEDCDGQGIGAEWFLLFGPLDEEQNSDLCQRRNSLKPVYFFDVAVKSALELGAPHRFVVLDTGPHPDSNLPKNFAKALEFAQVGWDNAPASATLVTHRPIWGLDTFSGLMQQQSDPEVLASFERAVQGVEEGGCKPFDAEKCGLKNFLSAHQRALEDVSFPIASDGTKTWALPQQTVVGNSGVKLEQTEPNTSFSFEDAKMRGRREDQTCGQIANWSNKAGYVVLSRPVEPDPATQTGWTSEMRLLKQDEPEAGFESSEMVIGTPEALAKSPCF